MEEQKIIELEKKIECMKADGDIFGLVGEDYVRINGWLKEIRVFKGEDKIE